MINHLLIESSDRSPAFPPLVSAVTLEFDAKLESHWDTGFTMNVTMGNISPFEVDGWTVAWGFEEPSLLIDSFWRSIGLAVDSNNNLYSLNNDEFNQVSGRSTSKAKGQVQDRGSDAQPWHFCAVISLR